MSISQTKEGYWIIDGDTHVSHWVRQEKRLDHDQNTLPILFKHVRPGDVVLDIGANIGDHTIAYSDWVGSNGKVIAFECGYEANACLRNNMRGRENVAIVDVALWSSDGWLNFNENNKNFGASFVAKSNVSSHDSPVKCIELDSLKFDRVNFIKIDAEGAECDILIGGKKTITRHLPVIVLEVNPSALIRANASEGMLMGLLRDLKYEWEFLFGEKKDGEQYDIIARYKGFKNG